MHIVIIGGGAAGFMAAITAAELAPHAQISLFEKQSKVLNKVRVSGGGRCNVTHNQPDVTEFAKQYPRGQHFLRKLMMDFGQPETITWFEKRGVKLKAEADGRIFPVSNKSETIIQCLCETASRLGVRVHTGVALVAFGKSDGVTNSKTFTLTLSDKQTIQADRLLIASGGRPKLVDYLHLTKDHLLVEPLPSLFTFNTPKNFLLPLMGVSVQDAELKIMETKDKWRGPLLITHWGFSGPAVLKLSAICARSLAALNYVFQVQINWIPNYHEASCRELLINTKELESKRMLHGSPKFGLPTRLWIALCNEAGIDADLRWADLSKNRMNKLVSLLTTCVFQVSGKTTFKEEFVTAGGVALSEVNPKTLESKHIPGLYFAGEILDVDGITGGFNFQNAWTTGYIAGREMATKLAT